MKILLSLCVYGSLGVFGHTQTTLGFALLQTEPDKQSREVNAIEILHEASQLASRQHEEHSFWYDRVLLKIADIQTRAHDFDGAKNTLKHCTYPYGRTAALVELAKTHAGAGQREQAYQVLDELGTEHGWNQNHLNDGVQAFWVDYLIATGKLESAQKAVDEMKVHSSRSEALCKLALAHAKLGDKTTTKRLFLDTLNASGGLAGKLNRVSFSDEPCLAIDICKVAHAQCEVVDLKTTSSMIQQLVQYSEAAKNGGAKVRYLREAAVLAAKVDDHETAKTLFGKAIQSRHAIQPPFPCPEANRIVALGEIAKAQASVGFIGDALETVAMIKDDGSERSEVLYNIAVAQAKAGQMADGIKTALSIEHYRQYQNDALLVIVDLFIEKDDRGSALTAAEKISNPSRKAEAILKVATGHAKDGDKKKAKSLAGQIQLEVAHDLLFFNDRINSFDFTKAETWGVMFEERSYCSLVSRFFTVKHARELAAAAMTLHQALGDHHQDLDFTVAFKDVNEDVIESLARAHAANGDAKAAYEWASRIGSDEKLEADSDFDSQMLVQQRLHALIGVADGLLAKSK